MTDIAPLETLPASAMLSTAALGDHVDPLGHSPRSDSTWRHDATWRSYTTWTVAICLAVGALAIILPVLRDQGFPLDDSWIYQVVGRNAARFGIPGFVPGVATGGSSSTIWPWIIALKYRVFPTLSPEIYLLCFNVLASCVIAVVLLSMARRDRLSSLEVAALAALPSITGNFAWFLSIGMEHLLFIATVFLAAYFWCSPGTGQRLARPMLAGTFLGLAIATRPEAVVFVPVFLGAGWWLHQSRRDVLAFLAPCLAFMALVALVNLWTSHSLMPVTLGGRKWLVIGALHEGRLALIVRLMGIWALQIVNFFIGLQFARGSIGYKLLVLVTCALLLLGLVRLVRKRAGYTLFLVLLAAVNFLVYCAMMPAPGQGMRYQAMLVVFIFPLLALGSLELIERLAARLAPLARSLNLIEGVTVSLVFVLALSSLYRWSEITDLGIRHINGTEIRMAQWLNAHLPPAARVASYDIGGIGYFANFQIIDLGGLTDPKYIPYLYSGRPAQFLKEQKVDWVVLSAGQTLRTAAMDGNDQSYCDGMTERLRLCDSAALHKTYVTSFVTPEAIWERGFRATEHADQAQVLYKIAWH